MTVFVYAEPVEKVIYSPFILSLSKDGQRKKLIITCSWFDRLTMNGHFFNRLIVHKRDPR